MESTACESESTSLPLEQGETVPYLPRSLKVDPKVCVEKSKRLAEAALEHYNKKKKIKFELLDAMPFISIRESCRCYVHINFIVRSRKEGSHGEHFFAELCYCGKRRGSSGYYVICCEPLGPGSTAGFYGFKDVESVVRKNVDFTYCFACGDNLLHPKGEKYIAGHCNIPLFYDSPLG